MRAVETISLTGLVLASIAGTARAQSARYDFFFDQTRSGLHASAGFAINTSGTLIGNWDADANPEGTRTKPGLFGSFGDDENLPAELTFDFTIGGDIRTGTRGTFRLRVNPRRGTARMARLEADLLAGGPQTLPADLTLESETFRTRSPESLFLGDIPITIPLGEITMSSMTIVQTEERAIGTLTLIEGQRYAFTVVPTVTLTAQFDVFGTIIDVPPTQVPFPLSGEIAFSGVTAELSSVQTLDVSESQPVGLSLPEFPLDLPTIIPPGDTAHLLMNLLVDEVAAHLTGDLTTQATGYVHP